MADDADDAAWTVVPGRSRGRRGRTRVPAVTGRLIGADAAAPAAGDEHELSEPELAALADEHARIRTELETSEYGQHCRRTLQAALQSARVPAAPALEVVEIVAFGLCGFGDSRVAQYQLALLDLLRQWTAAEVPSSAAAAAAAVAAATPTEIFDPQLTPGDRQLLAHLGMRVSDRNYEGRRQVVAAEVTATASASVPNATNAAASCASAARLPATLFYLPHLPLAMFEALLGCNWAPAQRTRMVLLGNALSTYLDGTPDEQLAVRAPHVLQARAVLDEHALPNTVRSPPHAFNDLALHRLHHRPEDEG